MKCEEDVELIVTVVRKGWGEVAMRASLEAGAQGGTIMFGRGIGIHEQKTLLGIPIEPEKEILLTVTNRCISEQVLDAVSKAVELDRPGTGFAMVIPLRKVVGRVHMLPP
ncbi:MAG: P-II family nitrogen regulator [Methanomassiliicoccales archaeon]|nr:P-II family nitrogen regulator [Methanomassiliicoccales archaeon]